MDDGDCFRFMCWYETIRSNDRGGRDEDIEPSDQLFFGTSVMV